MESTRTMLEQMLAFYEKKQYAAAEKIADDLVAANPHFHRGWFIKGIILEETGRAAEAQPCFEKAGNMFTLLFRLAAQLQDTDPERAMHYYKRVSAMDPKNNMVLFNKGLLHEKLGEHEEARQCFKNLSPMREIYSRIMIPAGFMLFLAGGAVMMIIRGETALGSIVVASAVFCIFWLRRDAGPALQMLRRKKAAM